MPKLERSDWDAANRAVAVRQGKGTKEREVFVAHGTAQALDDWLGARGERPGKLFLPIIKGGSVSGTTMSGPAVYKLFSMRRAQAGLIPYRCT